MCTVPFMIWNDKLSVEIEALDADHKRMLAVVNELYEAILTGKGKEAVAHVLDSLVEHVNSHFAAEESLFLQSDYPGAAKHLAEHRVFRSRLMELRELGRGAAPAPALELMVFVKDWLFDHVIHCDHEYVPYVTCKPVR